MVNESDLSIHCMVILFDMLFYFILGGGLAGMFNSVCCFWLSFQNFTEQNQKSIFQAPWYKMYIFQVSNVSQNWLVKYQQWLIALSGTETMHGLHQIIGITLLMANNKRHK